MKEDNSQEYWLLIFFRMPNIFNKIINERSQKASLIIFLIFFK